MNFFGLSITWSSTQRRINSAIVKLAQAAGVHINHCTIKNPMSLKTSSSLAIITAAIAAITRSRQANAATKAALDAANALLTPLQRENANLKIQKEQLETADDQLDQSLTELRAALDEADQPAVEEEDVEIPVDPNPQIPSEDTGSSKPGTSSGSTVPFEGNAGSPPPSSGDGSGSSAGGSVPVTGTGEATGEGNGEATTTGGTPSGQPGEKGPQGAEGTPSGN